MFGDLSLIPSTAQTDCAANPDTQGVDTEDESSRLSSKFKVYPRYVEPYVKTKCGIDGRKE